MAAGRRPGPPPPLRGRRLELTAPSSAETARLRRALLGWDRPLRDLPWRATRHPWAVLVSEVMLQQTQAVRVVPAWRAFLARFPDPAACADAAPADVVRAWAGLGYNRRALALHATARAVVDRHAGAVPDDLADLLALPGVGPYTARAVLAFAHEAPVAVVDTNVRRVLVRAVTGRPAGPAELQRLADRLVPSADPWRWNQAIIELGAVACQARPRCDDCPLRRECRWRRDGGPDPWRPAGVQAPFAGSDRQARGRLVAALRRGPVPLDGLAAAAGWPDRPERAKAVAAALVRDGLARVDGATMMLP